jgi:hypothetical protein
MLITCTVNEVTLATGASVAMMNAGPFAVWPPVIVDSILEAMPQPTRIKVAIVKAANEERFTRLSRSLCISDSLLSANSGTCTG